MSNLPDIPSPCVGVCKIEVGADICSGCLRTRDEIRNWRKSSNDEKYLMLQDLKKRRMAAGRISESDLRPRRRQKKS